MGALTKQEAHAYTVADVLLLQEQSGLKYELIEGQIFAMAGASEKHIAITGNLYALIYSHLRANKINCFPYASDLPVYFNEKNYYYPNIVVKCQSDSIKIIVEVSSKSTHAQDQTVKFDNYLLACKDLKEYVLVKQDVVQVRIYRRKDNWQLGHTYKQNSTIKLKSIGLSVAIEELYYWVLGKKS